jgi:hypothetical protein
MNSAFRGIRGLVGWGIVLAVGCCCRSYVSADLLSDLQKGIPNPINFCKERGGKIHFSYHIALENNKANQNARASRRVLLPNKSGFSIDLTGQYAFNDDEANYNRLFDVVCRPFAVNLRKQKERVVGEEHVVGDCATNLTNPFQSSILVKGAHNDWGKFNIRNLNITALDQSHASLPRNFQVHVVFAYQLFHQVGHHRRQKRPSIVTMYPL